MSSGPQISPDGNYYWDGQRWVPMQQPAREEAASYDQQGWGGAEDAGASDPNAPITIGSRTPDGQWWWDGKHWSPVSAPIRGAPLQPSPNPGTPAVLGAAALTAGFAWSQQLGGAAAWSMGFGLVSIIAPFAFNFYFPIMPLIGFLNAFRAFQRGRLIGAVIGIVLNAIGGLIVLLLITHPGG